MGILISTFQIFACIAATIKHGLRKIPCVNSFCDKYGLGILVTVICWILASILFVALVILFIPLLLYKTLVAFIVRMRHRKDFAGMLESGDSMWLAEEETAQNIINFIGILEFNKTEKNLVQFIKEVCESKFFTSKRLKSVRKFFMGYGYFLCNQVSVEEILSCVKISSTGVCNKSDLIRFIATYANTALPKDNTACFQIVICEDRVDLKDGNNSERYAILFRIHHSVGDGMTIFGLVARTIADKGILLTAENMKYETKKKSSTVVLKQNLKKLCSCESYINTLFTPRDRNPLRASKLSIQKTIAFKLETQHGVIVQKVKKIRRAFNCNFSLVVYAALCASLRDFFKRNYQKEVPEHFIMTFMVLTGVNKQHEDLKNTFSLGNIRLPIKDVTLPEILHMVIREYENYINSWDPWIYYLQLKIVCNLLPSALTRLLIRMSAITTAGFSNLPGFNQIRIGGHTVSDIMFWVPNFVTTGVGFSLITYDDRFQMGCFIDKSLISEQEEAQRVLDDIYSNIDTMYNIVCNNKE